MKKHLLVKSFVAFTAAIGLVAAVGLFQGCAGVQPGNDPLVVHTEQTETIAYSTFDTFLTLEDANRALVASNIPAVHAFAETLRQPVMDGTNLTRAALLWVMQLDRVKLAYEAGKATSNNVVTALAVVQTAVNAAQQDVVLIQGLKK